MSIVSEIRPAFEKNADPAEAEGMQAYMKNRFAFLGIKAPLRYELQKTFYPQIKKLNEEDQLKLCRQLYDLPEREYHYFAVEVLKRYFKKPSVAALPALRFFITRHSWWDTVDMIASHPLGNLVRTHPDIAREIDDWVTDSNLWIRRSALLYQLKYKDQTDVVRLFNCCRRLMHEDEFFIRKAIGWALREYAKTDPAAVKQFVAEHEASLSDLSRKEALRHLR